MLFILSARGPYLDVRVWRLNTVPAMKELSSVVTLKIDHDQIID